MSLLNDDYTISCIISVFCASLALIIVEYCNFRNQLRINEEQLFNHLDKTCDWVSFLEEKTQCQIKRDEITDLRQKYASLLSIISVLQQNCNDKHNIIQSKIEELKIEVIKNEELKDEEIYELIKKNNKLFDFVWNDQNLLKDKISIIETNQLKSIKQVYSGFSYLPIDMTSRIYCDFHSTEITISQYKVPETNNYINNLMIQFDDSIVTKLSIEDPKFIKFIQQ